MPYLRRLPLIRWNGRITARLTIEQRNLLLSAPGVAKDLGHGLSKAAVREGKLAVELKRESLDRLIVSAAGIHAPGKTADRELVRLLAYLESLADRFEEPPETETDTETEIKT